MTLRLGERQRLAWLGWLATVAMSLAFLPALAEKRYVFIGAFVAAAVVAAGVALRALRAPAALVIAVQLGVLAETLLLGYGRHLRYGVLPTGRSLDHVGDLIRSGMDVAEKYAAPAPRHPGLALMVVFFIGLVALLVDVLIALARVPLAGLPLLALYTVPVAALPDGVPFYGFIPGAVAFIMLLTADERDRLAHWGRLVSRDRGASPEHAAIDMTGLKATGRRVTVVALATAVVLPVFVPNFSGYLFSGGTGGGNGGGTQLTFNDPMVGLARSLRRDEPQDLLRVQSDISPEYLRLAVLDQPGPNAWSASGLNLSDTLSLRNVLPPPTGLSGAVRQLGRSLNIQLTDNFPANSAWLPVPFNSRYVGLQGDWAYVPRDQTVTATTDTSAARVRSYDVSYSSIDPTPGQLTGSGEAPASIRERYATVPKDVPFQVATTARQVTAGAANHYEQALLLQSFFRDRQQFTYDLSAAYGDGYQAMTLFLQARRGFCQHFAATMAMMARTLGIPSRVTVGFLQPTRRDADGRWVITSDNVHAWPELYFSGVGWVRFEPTPSIGAPLPSWAPSTTATAPTSAPTSGGSATDDIRDPRATSTSKTAAVGQGSSSGGDGLPPSRWWLMPIALLALLLVPAGLRSGVRRSRLNRPPDEVSAAESAWSELRDHVRDLRLPWTGSMTPRARERSVAPLLEGNQSGLSALNRLTLSVERARYAAQPLAQAAPATDAREVMTIISRNAERPRRVRAFLWPSSLMPDIRFGWAKLRGRLGRRPVVDE